MMHKHLADVALRAYDRAVRCGSDPWTLSQEMERPLKISDSFRVTKLVATSSAHDRLCNIEPLANNLAHPGIQRDSARCLSAVFSRRPR